MNDPWCYLRTPPEGDAELVVVNDHAVKYVIRLDDNALLKIIADASAHILRKRQRGA